MMYLNLSLIIFEVFEIILEVLTAYACSYDIYIHVFATYIVLMSYHYANCRLQ